MKTAVENLFKRIQYLEDLNDLKLGAMTQETFNSLYPSTYEFNETDYDSRKDMLIQLMKILKRPLTHKEIMFLTRWNPENDYAERFMNETVHKRAEKLISFTEEVIDNVPESHQDEFLEIWKSVLKRSFDELNFQVVSVVNTDPLIKEAADFFNSIVSTNELYFDAGMKTIQLRWKI